MTATQTVHERTANFTFRSSSDDGLTLDGYAAVFDEWTDIRDWLGTYRERISRGAFAKTIRERTPVLQFDHGRSMSIGSIPIGAIQSLEEDSRGLRVKARLHDNELVRPVRDAIASGAISGMSFQFEVLADSWEYPDDQPEERTITEVKLYELGPVVFPAYEQTTVGVRDALLGRLLGDEYDTLQGIREGRLRVVAADGTAARTQEPPAEHSRLLTDPRALRARARLEGLLP